MVKTSAQILFEKGYKKGYEEGYNEIFDKGLLIGASESLLLLLHLKFGEVPNVIKYSICTMTDPDKIVSLIGPFFRSETIGEFAAALKRCKFN